FLAREELRAAERRRLDGMVLAPSRELNALLEGLGTAPLTTGIRLSELLRRPQVTLALLGPFDPDRPALPAAVADQLEIEIKYEGYIDKQRAQAERMQKYRAMSLSGMDFSAVHGLRNEAREKLLRIRPENLGQAMNISGVSPADVSLLLLELSRQKREGIQ
ncbi:MAG: tRNA uridine-5-carboxymethylaminomethyl(34) synthesis enzyme MnmG, partial [Oscillospiraceae bacterium]